jgi:hypothetical protein
VPIEGWGVLPAPLNMVVSVLVVGLGFGLNAIIVTALVWALVERVNNHAVAGRL